MLNFIIFLIAGVGVTNIIVNSTIMEPLRESVISRSEFFGKLVTCMLCSGFWVGIFLWLISPGIFSSFYFSFLFSGAIISVASSFYDILTDYLIDYEEVDEAKD